MTADRLLVDTNALIHQLNGDKRVEELTQNATVHISFVTEIELLSYPGYTPTERAIVREQIREFIILDVNERTKAIAIELRAKYRLKLADAIIAATAAHLNIPLITQDKHFKKLKEEITLYQL